MVPALLAGAALSPLQAYAQEPAPAQPATGPVDDSGDIIVTAQKRSERLQDVPISIQALTAVDIERRSLTQVSQLPQSVPALRINYAGINIQPSIRGVGSLVAGPGFYSNIPVYVDGYYVPTPGASDFDLISISSVNVLKGPQGTLFGFNATGGAIQLNTREPQQTPTLTAKVGYGSYDHLTTAFYGSTGITETLAVDVAASFERGESFIRNVVTDDGDAARFRRWQVRSKVRWEASDAVNFTLAYAHRFENNPRAVLLNARGDETIGIRVPDNIIVSDRGDYAGTAPAQFRIESDSFTLTSRFDLGFADLTSYTGYRKDHIRQALDYDMTPANIYSVKTDIPNKTFTQEFNLSSKKDGPLDWVIGAFYMNTKEVYHFDTNTPSAGFGTGEPYNRLFNTTNRLKSYALFADATYEVAENLFLTAGGRYSINKPHLDYELIPSNARDSGGVKFTNFSPRGVIRYELTPQSNVYASFTQGYKSGTLPGSGFSLNPIDPEKIDAWELGYKIANRKVRFNVAGFYYNYSDIQVTAFGTNGASVTRNAAKAEIYGVDGELNYNITPDFSIDLSAAYTHAEYKKFPDAIGLQQDRDPASPTYGRFLNIGINANGFPVARTPRFSGNIGATYGMDVAGGRLVLNGSMFYTSKMYFDSVKQLPQKKYALLNLRATWTDPSEHYDISVFGTNVTDKKYQVNTHIDSYSIRQFWGDPAMIGASLTVRY
ncbi:TonB-dependent receptor [Sphingomonas sp. ID0503]|uniref:TonB-dependent receptor n=1 Tax=Sphingomonas sp. ID0503 TaxID=3399691 RepID=UPI003AFA2703